MNDKDGTHPPIPSLTAGQQMLSSGAGALVVSLLMTPLDVVKIRLQSQERLFAKKCFLYSNGLMDHLCPRTNGDPPVRQIHTVKEICDCKWYNRPKYFNSTPDAFYKIARTEGVTSLWSGLSPTLVLAIPATVVYFTMYEQLKVKIDAVRRSRYKGVQRDKIEEIPRWVSLTAGGLARWVAVSVVSPMELVRTKMQSQKMPFSQVRSCLADLVAIQGVRGLWNGYTATLLREVPFSALYWPLYEKTKSYLSSLYPAYGSNSFAINFVSASFAASVICTVIMPCDVLKTIKQIEIEKKDILDGKSGKSRSYTRIARGLVNERGVKSLFSGLTPRLLKIGPSCAILVSSYEFCKGFFLNRNLNQNLR